MLQANIDSPIFVKLIPKFYSKKMYKFGIANITICLGF